MTSQKYEFQMEMSCEGCSGAAKRILGRIEAVTSVETDLESQRVFVVSTLPPEQLLESLKKTGKECSYIGVAN